jgi:hypothetical protein
MTFVRIRSSILHAAIDDREIKVVSPTAQDFEQTSEEYTSITNQEGAGVRRPLDGLVFYANSTRF